MQAVTDPNELHDLWPAEQATARKLDGLLRTVYDYEAIDLQVKTNDKMIYRA